MSCLLSQVDYSGAGSIVAGSIVHSGYTQNALFFLFQGSYKHVDITEESFPFFFAVASLSVQLVAVLFWRRTTCSFHSIQVFYLRF